MTVKNDLISVIIPSFNRATLLKRAIDSVIAQEYRDIEIIVVDNRAKPVSAHLQIRTVKGKGRHGGKSASSSLRSTQNQTDDTINKGDTNSVK